MGKKVAVVVGSPVCTIVVFSDNALALVSGGRLTRSD